MNSGYAPIIGLLFIFSVAIILMIWGLILETRHIKRLNEEKRGRRRAKTESKIYAHPGRNKKIDRRDTQDLV